MVKGLCCPDCRENYCFLFFFFFFPGYVVAIVMTKKIPVMCTCPYVLLQWFSVSYTLPPPAPTSPTPTPTPSLPLLVCVSLPPPPHTPLS